MPQSDAEVKVNPDLTASPDTPTEVSAEANQLKKPDSNPPDAVADGVATQDEISKEKTEINSVSEP